MAENEAGAVLIGDLRAALEAFQQADAEVERLQEERRRQATLASLLLGILEIRAGEERSRALIDEAGLADVVARLPAVVGRRTVPSVRQTHIEVVGRAVRTTASEGTRGEAAPVPPGTFPRKTPVRMLGGVYAGWEGFIRRVRVRGGVVSYELEIVGPSGERARTDVGARSLGTKWEVNPPHKPEPAPEPAMPTRTVRRRRGGVLVEVEPAPALRRRARAVPGARPVEPFPRRTPVRMLAGRYRGWGGTIVSLVTRGATVTYDIALVGPDGHRAHTRVGQGTLGTTWEVAGPAPAEPEGTGRTMAAPAVPAAPAAPAAPATPNVIAPVAPQTASSSSSGVLAKGTAVRMLAGMYLGYSGVISSVQAKTTHGVLDALYTLSLTGPGNRKARTTVKHSSFGRVWVKA